MTATDSRIRSLPTAELTQAEIEQLRKLMHAAFEADDEGFSDTDWRHAAGGRHFLFEVNGEVRAHASVVPRVIGIGDRPLSTGYVEAVAVAPSHQRIGIGARIMQEVRSYIEDAFELGALSTGSHPFYERLGWRTWKGPTFVRTPSGLERTSDDDGAVMVLITPKTPPVDLTASISCDWRPGDVW
jgi:aminoglycoside 2'-N-acetyltransferase I